MARADLARLLRRSLHFVRRAMPVIVSAPLMAIIAQANPYLAKPGERGVNIRIATCAVSGGFIHLYTALQNNLFDKYGFKMEHVYIRGSGPSVAALMADEIQFLYCAAARFCEVLVLAIFFC